MHTRGKHEVPQQANAVEKVALDPNLAREKDDHEGKSRVLIIGGQFSGYFSANESKKRFYVTVIGAKEFFECTPTVFCANVKPVHLDTPLEREARKKKEHALVFEKSYAMSMNASWKGIQARRSETLGTASLDEGCIFNRY